MQSLEDRTLLLLVIAVSLAFVWILWPFFSAVLWATVLAIVFVPLYRRILRSIGQHPNLAALATLLVVVTLVILPLSLTATSLVQEATSLYDKIQSGELNLSTVFQQLREALPAWVTNFLDRTGLTNLGAVQERLSDALKKGSQFIAAQALNVGQGAADFVLGLLVMLYLLFFFLRDGGGLSKRIQEAIPLPPKQERDLFRKFTTVIRATIKGSGSCGAVARSIGWADLLAPRPSRSRAVGRGDGLAGLAAGSGRRTDLGTSRHLSSRIGLRMAGRGTIGVWCVRDRARR